MDLGSPISSVIPSAHGPVLAVLGRTDVWLTVAQVFDLGDGAVGRRRVADVLHDLHVHGLAEREIHGATKSYRLNRDHVAAPGIIALADLREALIDRIRISVERWTQPAAAVWLFGSAARGDGDSRSDIDLLVVHPAETDDAVWAEQIDALALEVERACGNGCQILDLSEPRFRRMIQDGERLVDELWADALRVSGMPLRQYVRDVRRAGAQ